MGFKLDIDLYRYSYIQTPFLFSRRSSQISAFRRNPKLCGIQDSDSPPHATIALPQAVIQKMVSLALQWKHPKDPIFLLTARLQVWLWQDPKSPRAHQPAPVKGEYLPSSLTCTCMKMRESGAGQGGLSVAARPGVASSRLPGVTTGALLAKDQRHPGWALNHLKLLKTSPSRDSWSRIPGQ